MTPKALLSGGVVVKVLTDKEMKAGFTSVVTDIQGIYKIHFAVPVRWNRVDFTGKILCGPEWSISTPETLFRLYFNRNTGVLDYSPRTVWTTVAPQDVPEESAAPGPRKIPKPQAPAKEEPKKGDEFFGSFEFGK